MKSERRHELETNSLALWLRWRSPELLAKHGSKLLLAVVIVILAIFLIRQRMQAPRLAAQAATDDLALARDYIDRMRFDTRGLADNATNAHNLITKALGRTDAGPVQADAYLAMGEYYWTLANYPNQPGAATRPELRPPEGRNESLAKGEEAYQKVLGTSDANPYQVATARFGLGAIYESRAWDQQQTLTTTQPANELWAKAFGQYKAIIDDNRIAMEQREIAGDFADRIERIKQPVWLAPPVPSTASTTQSTTRAATTPATPPITPAVER